MAGGLHVCKRPQDGSGDRVLKNPLLSEPNDVCPVDREVSREYRLIRGQTGEEPTGRAAAEPIATDGRVTLVVCGRVSGTNI